MSENTTGDVSVLLVEDNEIDVEVTKRVLAKAGVPVALQVARDGADAMDVLLRWRGSSELPRLVLLDLQLPGLDGPEVLRRIKGDTELCAIPVAVLTRQGGNRAMMRCMELGGNMFFVKPMTLGEAVHILRAVEQYWVLMDRLLGKAGR
jgi:CheY-like chemotaxis protein